MEDLLSLRPMALMLIGGLSFRFALTLTGQNWAKTYQQTVAFLVLPFVTYIITKTISGNIALSLGMIGAMSIVRFRNPVKSALELVMYFALITMGISASVRTKWARPLTQYGRSWRRRFLICSQILAKIFLGTNALITLDSVCAFVRKK